MTVTDDDMTVIFSKLDFLRVAIELGLLAYFANVKYIEKLDFKEKKLNSGVIWKKGIIWLLLNELHACEVRIIITTLSRSPCAYCSSGVQCKSLPNVVMSR